MLVGPAHAPKGAAGPGLPARACCGPHPSAPWAYAHLPACLPATAFSLQFPTVGFEKASMRYQD